MSKVVPCKGFRMFSSSHVAIEINFGIFRCNTTIYNEYQLTCTEKRINVTTIKV